MEDELHKEAGHASLDEYATDVLHMDRTAVYEFIKDGNASPWWPRLARRRTGPCWPAQAKVLAPIVETHG
ncbi:hypothetical protein ACFW9I_34955 [[Kitasatospora] papulosa]|uniref:hypothetical protein n=1 Tax=[Kitasatospora] papulosa TaxID=1464011 RepID=UPI00368E13EC